MLCSSVEKNPIGVSSKKLPGKKEKSAFFTTESLPSNPISSQLQGGKEAAASKTILIGSEGKEKDQRAVQSGVVDEAQSPKQRGNSVRSDLPSSLRANSTVSFIKYLSDGHIDTMNTHIDFTTSRWYEDFLEVQKVLENTSPISETEIQSWLKE